MHIYLNPTSFQQRVRLSDFVKEMQKLDKATAASMVGWNYADAMLTLYINWNKFREEKLQLLEMLSRLVGSDTMVVSILIVQDEKDYFEWIRDARLPFETMQKLDMRSEQLTF